MSRHRAEPDDDEEEVPAPPPTADTGPLMFGQRDWPPLRPPDPGRETRESSFINGAGESNGNPAHNHRHDDRPRHDRPRHDRPRHDRPGPDLENQVTSKLGYPLLAEPVQARFDQRVERAPLATAAPAPSTQMVAAPVEQPPLDEALLDEHHVEDPADELGLLTPEPVAEKGHRRGGGRRASGKRARRPIAVVLTLALIAALVTGIFYGSRAVIDLITTDPAADYAGQGSGTVEIEVVEGATTAAIAEVLVDSGVVASSEAFLDAAAGNPEILNIQPGVYQLRQEMSGQAALDLLLDPASRLFDRVTIPEGYTVDRTLETLAEKSEIPLADFEAAAADPTQLGVPGWSGGGLEGFLFPATYDIGPDSTAVSVLTEMVAKFNEVAAETGLEANAAAVGLTPYEALTVASLIQSEVTVEAERPMVARVIYNRIDQSMPLGIDAALAYELGVNGNELTTEMLTTDSPYNTRIRLGLPPTPISNPGQPSMLGALQPAVGDWIYYVLSTADGDHYFTANYEDFLAAKAQCEAAGLGCG